MTERCHDVHASSGTADSSTTPTSITGVPTRTEPVPTMTASVLTTTASGLTRTGTDNGYDERDILALARACPPQIVVTNNSPGSGSPGGPPPSTDAKKLRHRPPPLQMPHCSNAEGGDTDDEDGSRCSSVYFDASEGEVDDAKVSRRHDVHTKGREVADVGADGVNMPRERDAPTTPSTLVGVVTHRSPLDTTIATAMNVLVDTHACISTSQRPVSCTTPQGPAQDPGSKDDDVWCRCCGQRVVECHAVRVVGTVLDCWSMQRAIT